MKEILFRGKLIADGSWSYGNLVVKPNNIAIITPDDTPLGKYGQVDPGTVGQFTGITDKNGKKIFEGDIVDFPKRADNDNYGVVTYSDAETEFCIVYDNYYTSLGGAYWGTEIEVLGNIHDRMEIKNA